MGRRTAFVLVLLLAGCGTASPQVQVGAPWDPELALFFDDAADFIANPGNLEGTWATDYAAELRGRVDASDLICRIHVATVREDIAVDGTRRKHLLATVTSVSRGDEPPDGRVHLIVDEGSAGFDTIDRNTRRVLDNRFLAFIRWYEDENGQVRAHWHLSPATREVIETARRAQTEREQTPPED